MISKGKKKRRDEMSLERKKNWGRDVIKNMGKDVLRNLLDLL